MSKVPISVPCGQCHLVVVVRDAGSLESTVFSSGVNEGGQLGLGDLQDRKLLAPVEYTRSDGMMISKVRAGLHHTLALSLDGKHLYACGLALYGQCGISKEQPAERQITRLRLVQFPDDDLEIEEISCGENHNLAIGKPKGGLRKVYTWGSTVPDEYSCVLGHLETDKNEYCPRELVLTRKDDSQVKGVWLEADGGSQH